MEERESHQAAAAGGSIAFGSSSSPLPETANRRRRRPSPPFVGTAYLPDHEIGEHEYLEFEVAAAPSKRARLPASEEAIQGLKEVTASGFGGDECAICLQDLLPAQGGDPLRAMPCSHAFHQRCIFEWLRRDSVCPMCRHQLPSTTPPPPTEEPAPPPQQQQQQRMPISAYHFDDEEDAIAALGDAVIHQEFEEVSQEEVDAAEERSRANWALIEGWIREDRENRNQLQASEFMMDDGSIEWIDGSIASFS